MLHEISLTDYVDHGRATIREARYAAPWSPPRSESYYRLDRRSQRILGPLDCDCDACVGIEKPPVLSVVSKSAQDEGQLELPGVG